MVYIGCTESPGGTIARRLTDHLPTRADVQDVARRLREARKVGELEVAWKSLATPEEAMREEARLLRSYVWDHVELPPINRSEPAGDTRVAIEAIADFIQSEGQLKCQCEKDARELVEKLVEHLSREKRREKRATARTSEA